MASEEKLDSQPKRRRWRRAEEEEVVEAAAEEEAEDEEEVEADTRGLTAKKGRPTPSRRQMQEAEVEETGNVVTRPANRLVEYLRSVRSELSKVTWPTREEALGLSRIVLVTTIVSAIILGIVTLFFTELFRIGLDAPVIFVGLFVIVIALLLIYQRRSSERSSPY